MQRLLADSRPFVIQQVYDALQQQGIACVIRNQFLAGAAGELPVQDTELWLMKAEDYGFAQRVVQSLQTLPDGETWVCGRCSEVHSSEFHICWQCQQLRTE